jgi:pseudouridylate synthase
MSPAIAKEPAMASRNAPIDIAREVADALETGRPVVALESTIVTHGMPYPDNAAMAAGVEAVIREEGAIPATIAVIDGRLKVGLSEAERESLAQARGAMKLSRADLAFAMATGATGGTTVAATMIAAELAGIEVFATGGIGGVHKGAEKSFDISADLDELARTAVIVVSAGAKAILDVEKTLEVLETRGVPVVAYGTDTMPAFWSRQSPHPAPLRLDDAGAIARFFSLRRRLGLEGGMLVANPVPAKDEIAAHEMAAHIATAQREADEKGVSGKAVTPFLLSRILELTGGASLATNIALVRNNARLAARIAGQLAALRKAGPDVGEDPGRDAGRAGVR